tara:strand:+ start:340 stop:546 length:207 start_codon:yes stop_codon:yes gene_type:complete
MYSLGRTAYINLKSPKSNNKKEPTASTGLLARGPKSMKQNQSTEMQPSERIATYVMQLREARQGLNND